MSKGFGGGTSTGFGKSTGWGGATGGTTSFGKAAGGTTGGTSGWGGTSTGTKGFGGAAGGSTWGGAKTASGGQQQPAPTTNPYATPAGTAGATVVGQYLLQWDNVYNADHPDCKFRDFFYNMCTPGHAEHAIQREKLAPTLRGNGGCREDQWIVARRDNPDPDSMYPCPVHFNVGLKARALKQKEQIEKYHTHVNTMLKSLAELKEIQEQNADQHARLVLEESMLEGKLLIAMGRAEALRQGGLKMGSERHSVAKIAEGLRATLATLGAALNDLEQLPTDHATPEDTASMIAACTPTTTIKEWVRFVEGNEAGIAKLHQIIEDDSKVIKAILRRISDA